MKPTYWLVLGVAAVGATQVAACSSNSHSCEETRTCGTADAGAGQGEAEAGAGGESGAAGAAQAPVIFGSCSKLGLVACEGEAGAERLACDGEQWRAGTTCAQGQLCDSSTGKCEDVISECVGATPGAVVCRDDKPLTCGPDLVTASEAKACPGLCKVGVCQAPVCGDKKLEAGEDCDDGATDDTGTCAKCKAATCGDGSLHAGVEECDDGNDIAGDGCSPSCNFEPVAVVAGDYSTCAISKAGGVKCWGDNLYGELGIGTRESHGDVNGSMGTKLDYVSLGAGRTAKSVSVGNGSACAVLDNGDLKCWGNNVDGTLGTGEVGPDYNRGDGPGEMGDRLSPIPLGAGHTAIAVSQATRHTCAVLEDGEAKCWGRGTHGQLGQDAGIDYFSPASLPAIALGGKATFIRASVLETTCALLADGSGKCWGLADYGTLSVAPDLDKGTSPFSNDFSSAIGDYSGPNAPQGEMALLPGLSVGAGLTIEQIGIGAYSACALLSDETVKCWGTSGSGQLGLGFVGAQGGETPAALAALKGLDLGTGRTAKAISVGSLHSCALLDNGSVKCWGANYAAQLGIGSREDRGAKPGQMGDNLLAVPLGTHKALQVSAGDLHTCALLDDGTVVCWGDNTYGELGVGNTTNVGDTPNFTLTPVDLAF